jgi:hypothetical protein
LLVLEKVKKLKKQMVVELMQQMVEVLQRLV